MDPVPEGISSAAGIIPELAGKLPEPGPGPRSVGTVPDLQQHIGHLPTWGVHLSVSYLSAFSYCSWGSQGKN